MRTLLRVWRWPETPISLHRNKDIARHEPLRLKHPMHTPRLLAVAITLALASGALAQNDPDVSMHKRLHFEKKITRTVEADYLLFLPEGYQQTGEKKWPLMLFLHGAGERGTNLSK